MKWINVKDALPPRLMALDHNKKEVDLWYSGYVLVARPATRGILQYDFVKSEYGYEIGAGSYDYDRKQWTYNLFGKIEMDNNEITHWCYPPKPPNHKERTCNASEES